MKKNRLFFLLIICAALLFVLNSCEEESANPNGNKPTVSIVAPPKNAIVYTDTLIQISASDDQGVTAVDLYIGGDSIYRFTHPPYQWLIQIDSLRDSTGYLVYAKAYDAEGNVTRSQASAFFIQKFSAPANLSVQYVTRDSIELRWDDLSRYEKSFDIERSLDNFHFDVIQNVRENSKKAVLSGPFSTFATYYFRVRGIGTGKASPYSRVVKVSYGPGGENLFVGGSFTSAGNAQANHIGRWNAMDWSVAGAGMNDRIMAMATYNGELYAGGPFSKVGDSSFANIAKWDGSKWSRVGNATNALDGRVTSLLTHNGSLYAGGFFYKSGETVLNYIGRWDGSSWHTVGAGFNGKVYALAEYHGELYAAGEFTFSGGIVVTNIARWDEEDQVWQPLGSGADGIVFAMTVYKDELFIGGTMNFVGGYPVNHVARWNDTTWSPASGGFDDHVYSLQEYNSELYAGGAFTETNYMDSQGNEKTRNTLRIAKWSGISWTAVGSGFDNWVLTMGTYNGGLYAGGEFTKTGNLTIKYLARWNGLKWDEVGGGPSNWVYSLGTYTGDSWKWEILPNN